MSFTHEQQLNKQLETLNQRWFTKRVQKSLPFRWILNARTNELVYRNLTQTLRYDLGVWASDTGVATVYLCRRRCEEIIDRSLSDVWAAELATGRKYEQWHMMCDEQNRIAIESYKK